MIKASSLFYSILICTLVAGFCASIIITYDYYHRLESKYNYKSQLYSNCLISFNQQLLDLSTLEKNCSLKKWGMLPLLSTQIIHHIDTIQKNGFIGTKLSQTKKALQLINPSSSIKIEGNSHIHGDVYTNGYTCERGFHFNASINAKKLISGQTFKQKVTAPSPKAFTIPTNTKIISINDLESQTLFNSFQAPTVILQLEDTYRLNNFHLSGNIILQSETELSIEKNCDLDNIIIKAPKVIFKSGFKGNCQVYASNIVTEPKCILTYPSCFYSDLPGKFSFENSKLYGAIINKVGTIDLLENSIVYGDVYTNNSIQLNGTINGTLYTKGFHLNTTSSQLKNYILNGEINPEGLPENFVKINLFNDFNQNTYELIKNI